MGDAIFVNLLLVSVRLVPKQERNRIYSYV